jgi:prolyl oligopeptidase
VQSQQFPTESQVFEDEALAGTANTDHPAEKMSERRDHSKKLTGTFRIQPLAKSFFLQVYDVWTRHRSINLKFMRPRAIWFTRKGLGCISVLIRPLKMEIPDNSGGQLLNASFRRHLNADLKLHLSSIIWIPVLLTASCSFLAVSEKTPAILETPKKPVVETYHGVKVQDDYQWLEDWNDPAVRAWSDSQNAHARAVLDALPGRQLIHDRLATLRSDSAVQYFAPLHSLGLLFFLKLQPPKQQPFLVSLNPNLSPESERAIVDPNVIDSKGLTAIDFYVPSLDSRYVAVSMSEGGTEEGTVLVYDIQSGKPLPEAIPRVNGGTAGGSLAWNGDASGFYYTRYPSPGERPAADLDFFQQIYFHKLGTAITQDTYVLGKDFPRIAEVQLRTSRDGRYILAIVANGDGGQFEHFLLSPNGQWTQLTKFSDRITQAVFGQDQAIYLISENSSPRGTVLRMPLDQPSLANASTVVPAAEDVVEAILPTTHRLYVLGVWGGPSDVRVFDLQGHEESRIPVPPISAVNGLVALEGDDIIYQSESYLTPAAWFSFDSASGKAERTNLFTKPAADFSDAEVVREFATSKDGTKIPINIIRRKGTKLDGKNPTFLTGYGGYKISISPAYNVNVRVWLDQGGVFAEANLRGGAEYGDDWHRAGMLTKKQNVFDDFAACAEYLIQAGYTNSSRLAIAGGSNGGLLMGAEITQHPKLFRAVASSVGIYDMLRNELSPNAVFNVTEYGSVKDPVQFRALYAYSPYHHVVEGTPYPAVLFLTGANDPRVNPMHSRKMAARLQAATSSGLPILLRTSSNSGHINASLNERIERTADIYAFLLDELGVPVKP